MRIRIIRQIHQRMILAVLRKSQISVAALRWYITRVAVTSICFGGCGPINCLYNTQGAELCQGFVEQIVAVRLICVRYQITPPLMADLVSVISQVERLIQRFPVSQHETVEAGQ